MKEEKKYKVRSHKFVGCSKYNEEIFGYTYEITFNKSLEHTGRFTGIEDGLNAYVKNEYKTDIRDNFKRLWYSIIRWAKN